jgi:predicted DNA-binding protein (UPF0278 family)
MDAISLVTAVKTSLELVRAKLEKGLRIANPHVWSAIDNLRLLTFANFCPSE